MNDSIFRARSVLARTLLLLAALTMIGGCGIFSPDEGDDDNTTETDPWVPSTSTAQFITNFERAWEERNIDRYDELLGENFIFYFSESDVDAPPAGFWDRASEMDTANQMFGTPRDPANTVTAIEFRSFEVEETFTTEIQDPDLLDADVEGTYAVRLEVQFPGGAIPVQGLQTFYLKKVDKEIDGEMRSVYVLRAWKDLGVSLN